MSVFNGLFSNESVAPGHPDNICDRISDAVLDAFLRLDPDARVASESMAADAKIIVAREFSTRRREHFAAVRGQAPALVRRVLRDIGKAITYSLYRNCISNSFCGFVELGDKQ
jgi:S-adenosylmethionine synthetase